LSLQVIRPFFHDLAILKHDDTNACLLGPLSGFPGRAL
jgi:hypothetical protein